MTIAELALHLLRRLREVQQHLGGGDPVTAATPFAEAVDSMGLVEFVGVVADDCGISPEAIERAARRRFVDVGGLASALHAAGIVPRQAVRRETPSDHRADVTVWLGRWEAIDPAGVEAAEDIDRALGKPPGWLAQHAGIERRWRWRDEDPLARTAVAGLRCAGEHRLAALLLTSEAPHRPLGQAAALHERMHLPVTVPALEVGGACVGFLHCLWLARRMLRRGESALVAALEAPSRWLSAEDETAALFGDGAAVCLSSAEPLPGAAPLRDILLGCDGAAGSLIELDLKPPAVRMDGPALALRAVQQLADGVRDVCERNAIRAADLEAVHIHAGNGRMPPLVARLLGVPSERVVSTTTHSGNLGSASLLAALAGRPPSVGPVVLAAVGAGVQWGAALFDAPT